MARMAQVPANPKVYHITPLDNLAQIVNASGLWSDAKRIDLNLGAEIVGMNKIKRRRLEELEVKCHAGTMVGQYVPFYFCPRSVMLYILHMKNHPELSYRGGQEPIVHLQVDLMAATDWADSDERRWAVSDRNAGTFFAAFYCSRHDLDNIDWRAVASTDFRDPETREGKQAEFLVYESFPWHLVEKIGVINSRTQEQVLRTLGDADHKPLVSVERGWYY